ncbi:hypothetical protein MASR2M78_19910 [Treponema sp.]
MNIEELRTSKEYAQKIRYHTIDAIGALGVGHSGGAMSIADLLAVLYGHCKWPASLRDRDRLVLSKGHAGPALYAALALKGFFPLTWLSTLNRGSAAFFADRNLTPGIDMSTSSLEPEPVCKPV